MEPANEDQRPEELADELHHESGLVSAHELAAERVAVAAEAGDQATWAYWSRVVVRLRALAREEGVTLG